MSARSAVLDWATCSLLPLDRTDPPVPLTTFAYTPARSSEIVATGPGSDMIVVNLTRGSVVRQVRAFMWSRLPRFRKDANLTPCTGTASFAALVRALATSRAAGRINDHWLPRHARHANTGNLHRRDGPRPYGRYQSARNRGELHCHDRIHYAVRPPGCRVSLHALSG